MDYFSNFASQRRANQLDKNKRQLMDSYNASLRNQTEATGKLLEIAGKQTAAQQVAGQQGSYYFQDWARQKQLQFGATNPIPQPVQPPITAGQKVQVGAQALQSTPDVFVMGSKLAQSQRDWNRAGKLEKRVLEAQAQQTLNETRNPARFQGDTFYDAYESSNDIEQAFPKPIFTPQNNDAQVYFGDAFKRTADLRYGNNPFQGVADPRRDPITPNMPQPTGYSSSKGWIYPAQYEYWLPQQKK